jgi:tetratricopeptide (TPR) repeat protein
MMRSHAFRCLAMFAAAMCWTGRALGAENQSWSVAASGPMRVITDLSPAVGARLLDELVATRSILTQATSVEPVLPVDVFALKDARSLSELAPREFKRGDARTFGFSHTGPHSAFIALRMDRPEPLILETLRHEYAHVLTAAQLPEAPSWLDEGLAEFWGATRLDGERIVVGRPVAEHIETLRRGKWLTLNAMLKQRRGSLPSNAETLPLFYAQSWAMVYYLLVGQNAGGPIAFMPADITLPSRFEALVRQYVADAHFNEVSIQWRPPASSHATVTTISEAQALAERANMLVSSADPRTALPIARRALAINPDERLALEVIGTYHFLNNQHDEARSWLARALGGAVNSYRAPLYLSLLSTSRGDRERYLTLAIASRPASDVAWQRLGAIFQEDGRLETARRWCRAWSRHPIAWVWPAALTRCGTSERQ